MPVQRLGLIVNPIAGLGGTVALHGTDGVVTEALQRGATPTAGSRAERALAVIARGVPGLDLVTYGGDMGEMAARAVGLVPRIVGRAAADPSTALDTRRAALDLVAAGIDLLLFAGGDGTACDLLDAVGSRVSLLGVPAGVKMHSAVFATTPATAGEVVCRSCVTAGQGAVPLRAVEIMDVDEAARRRGELRVSLRGVARSPYLRRLVQNPKARGARDEPEVLSALAEAAAALLDPRTVYLLGPGTTMLALKERLGLQGSLLGVDAMVDGRPAGVDLTERQILSLLDSGRPAHLIVSPIGGQGFVFGRGNQPLSAAVLRRIGRGNITLLATVAKLAALAGTGLLVDTGDENLDRELAGWYRLLVGPNQTVLYRIAG